MSTRRAFAALVFLLFTGTFASGCLEVPRVEDKGPVPGVIDALFQHMPKCMLPGCAPELRDGIASSDQGK